MFPRRRIVACRGRDCPDVAEAAATELRSEQEAFAEIGPITDADMSGRVGQFFNALEKAMSVVEPQPERYGSDELRSAFEAEPSCTFVVQ